MGKRKHWPSVHSSDASSIEDIRSPPRTKTKSLNPSSTLQICTIHRVHCDQSKNHAEHPSVAYFEDHPRLFEGDCKASALRGQILIENISEYLETRSHLKVMFYRIYSCNSYHDELEGHFRPLERPVNPFVESMSPYFYRIDSDGKLARSHEDAMTISSEELLEALKDVTGMGMEALSALKDPVNTRKLVTRLYHYREIRKRPYLSSTQDTNSIELVSDFIDVMENMFGSEYEEADALFLAGQVEMAHLPKLFVADDVLVTTKKGLHCGYQLDFLPTDPLQIPLELSCWNWEFDGRFWKNYEEFSVEFPSEHASIPITDLSIYPLKYATPEVQEVLATRGRQFWFLRNGSYVSYTQISTRKDAQMVIVLDFNDEAPADLILDKQTAPRYMIDMTTYRELHEDQEPDPEKIYLSDESMRAEQPPDEAFILLLPATIRGFGLKAKNWRELNVSGIGPIKWKEEAFDHLVLQSTKKELIRALVKKHDSMKESMDIIEGKGNGLILLLHGGPGTGKTLTAESVAELTHRPLYRVTCGDVGTNAEEVEQYLESALYLGKVWRCVVLLDEADVFLEERTRQDLKRNALVSVFLRVIEYYDGILILTSNRIGTFDEAFKSRVQLVIHYPSLQQEERRRVWSTFITGLQSTNAEAHIDEIRENIGKLSRYDLNGREIRNAIQTATLLAQFKESPLAMEHLNAVIDVSAEFKKYLVGRYGDDDEYAQVGRIR